MRINQERIWQRILELADVTIADKPYTRRAFTDIYLEGRELLKQYYKEAGLKFVLSPAANIIGTRAGTNANALPIAMGSHIDTVLEGGRFDGIAGVITALEVAEIIKEQNIQLKHPLVIIDFLSEEPSDYGLSCIGSRGHSARLTAEQLRVKNPDGETLENAMERMGASIQDTLNWQPLSYRAFLELHIEQAKRLERTGTDIGVVSGFAGIWRYKIRLEGQADHAGATPMTDRQDALVAASKVIQSVQETASQDNSDLVATVGQLSLKPDAVNAVPGIVSMSLEVRCLDANKQELILETTKQKLSALVEKKAIRAFSIEPIIEVSPRPCDTDLQTVFSQACDSLGFSHMSLSSGAGHDAYHMGFICPSAMIFIPSKDGFSHTPAEYSSPEQLAKGAEVLLESVLYLDQH